MLQRAPKLSPMTCFQPWGRVVGFETRVDNGGLSVAATVDTSSWTDSRSMLVRKGLYLGRCGSVAFLLPPRFAHGKWDDQAKSLRT